MGENPAFFLDSWRKGRELEKKGVAILKSLLYSLGKKTTEYFVFRAG